MRQEIFMQKRSDDYTIQEAFDKFIAEKRAIKLSGATIKGYKSSFKHFSEFYPVAVRRCNSITNDTVLEFINFLQDRNPNIKAVSINTYLRDLRVVLYNFMEHKYMDKFKLKLIKEEIELKETYSNSELERLLKKPDVKKCSFADYRNWVITCYLLGTGNRLGTISNIKIKDVDLENYEISLRKVKNKKQYIIPLASSLIKTLAEYLDYRGGEPDDYLFCTRFGGKMHEDSFTTAIYRYNHSRGVLKTSIHLYRHTFAKNWILNGGDEFTLQAILGHSSSAMVRVYVNMFGKDLGRNFDKFNPLENMREVFSSKQSIKMRA